MNADNGIMNIGADTGAGDNIGSDTSTPRQAAPLIAMTGINQWFPPNTQALDNVTLSISAGQSVAITGPSGSGKSTLLAIMGLLATPESGSYLFDGVETTTASKRQLAALRRNSIGYVFQSFHLIEYLTVRENILNALAIKSVRGRQAASRARELLDQVGLGHRIDDYPTTLSGGECQRAAIARAIAVHPKLLLCDEPTGNLDSKNSAGIVTLLTQLLTPQSALVIVTHDPHIAQQCHRQITIIDGHAKEGGYYDNDGRNDNVVADADINPDTDDIASFDSDFHARDKEKS